MSKDYLPTEVTPLRLAENATTLHGHLLTKSMERLATSLYDADAEAEVKLQFGIEQGIRYMKGNLSAHLILQCQRCMESFVHEVTGDFSYGIVATEEKARKLPKRFDAIILTEDLLNLQDIIEQELIINLPIVPMHCSEECKVQMPVVVISEPGAKEDKLNPFKVIELLKVKNKLGD